jgi:hypothetical protein
MCPGISASLHHEQPKRGYLEYFHSLSGAIFPVWRYPNTGSLEAVTSYRLTRYVLKAGVRSRPSEQWFRLRITNPLPQMAETSNITSPCKWHVTLSKKAKRVVQSFRRRGYLRVPIISNVAIRHSALHLMSVLQRCSLLYSLTHACVSVALGLLCFSSCFCLFLSSTLVLHRSP